jgi:molybdopterin-guanine dinucleotide biosynthesis protein B
MALVKPVIFQIVGFQNSGKTKVMSELIKGLTSDHLHVVSIKHHGHGGKPEAAMNKDSSKHLDSGAVAAIVEGEGSLLLQAEKSAWTLEEKVQLGSFFHPDIILIEGYKKESFPKLLLVRYKDDVELLQKLNNVKAVMVWDEFLTEQQTFVTDIPWFDMNDRSAIDWTINYLKSQL